MNPESEHRALHDTALPEQRELRALLKGPTIAATTWLKRICKIAEVTQTLQPFHHFISSQT